MEVLVLASGSSGNAALVRSGSSVVLVDAGVSALQIRRRMEAFGVVPEQVDAVFLTHEHSDHVRGLEVFLRRHRAAPVWATAGTFRKLRSSPQQRSVLRSGMTVIVGGLRVTAVETSHDAAEPVAYVFDDGSHSAGLCTDTGRFTTLLQQRMQGCELLLLEANHDRDLLRHGPYPWPLKQRIDSSTGHLSNHQSLEAIGLVGSSVLRAVVGLHLSAENNCPTMVCESLQAAAGPGVAVAAVTRQQMLRVRLNSDGASLEHHELP
jgi:phosphoribosyl 1,2-cyclic phosphodiesterase